MHGRIIAVIWICYGLLAAVLGTVQATTRPPKSEKERRRNVGRIWSIVWLAYGCLAAVIGIAMVLTAPRRPKSDKSEQAQQQMQQGY